MSVKIGDKVRFLNDVGSGIVVRIDKNTVYVSDEDGFERPSPLSQIVIVESIDAQKTKRIQTEITEAKKSLQEVTKKIKPAETNDNCLYLAVTPEGESLSSTNNILIELLNDSDQIALFNIYFKEGDLIRSIKAGFLEPNNKELIRKLTLSGLNKTIGYQIITYTSNNTYPFAPATQGEINLKDTQLVTSKEIKLTPFYEKPALLYKLQNEQKRYEAMLTDLVIKDIPIAKEKPKQTKNNINEILEIDLHIEQLRDDSNRLLPNEILPIQMERFHQVMKENLSLKGKRIVFIHGIGSGKLKTEILKLLKQNYSRCYVQDASFQEYGFGATMVTIK